MPVKGNSAAGKGIPIRPMLDNEMKVRAISVVKKRVGPHEETIREFKISVAGVAVGVPLEEFRAS